MFILGWLVDQLLRSAIVHIDPSEYWPFWFPLRAWAYPMWGGSLGIGYVLLDHNLKLPLKRRLRRFTGYLLLPFASCFIGAFCVNTFGW